MDTKRKKKIIPMGSVVFIKFISRGVLMSYKVFMVEGVRTVLQKETYFVISDSDKETDLLQAIENERLTPVQGTEEVIEVQPIERIDSVESVNPKLMRMMSKAFRETNKRLNDLKQEEKTETKTAPKKTAKSKTKRAKK